MLTCRVVWFCAYLYGRVGCAMSWWCFKLVFRFYIIAWLLAGCECLCFWVRLYCDFECLVVVLCIKVLLVFDSC